MAQLVVEHPPDRRAALLLDPHEPVDAQHFARVADRDLVAAPADLRAGKKRAPSGWRGSPRRAARPQPAATPNSRAAAAASSVERRARRGPAGPFEHPVDRAPERARRASSSRGDSRRARTAARRDRERRRTAARLRLAHDDGRLLPRRPPRQHRATRQRLQSRAAGRAAAPRVVGARPSRRLDALPPRRSRRRLERLGGAEDAAAAWRASSRHRARSAPRARAPPSRARAASTSDGGQRDSE